MDALAHIKAHFQEVNTFFLCNSAAPISFSYRSLVTVHIINVDRAGETIRNSPTSASSPVVVPRARVRDLQA